MIATNKIIVLCVLLAFMAIPASSEEIHNAAQKGDLAKMKRILEKNPGLLEARSDNEKTPLHFAAQGGHKEVVEFLLAQGADVNAENIIKETPLHYAAALGYEEVMNLLISEGALLSLSNINGDTPLHYSARIGNSESVKVLIDKGADINGRNKYDLTPLDLAYDLGQNEAAQLIALKGGLSSPVDDPEVVPLSDNVYSVLFLKGNQSNIGISAGNDGVLLVDTGFSRRAETHLRAAISQFENGEVKCIINTHLHQDHIACNNIGGEFAVIIDFNNLEKIASDGIIKRAGGPVKGKAGRSFKDHFSLNFNGEEIKLIPCPGIHSDADLIIYFTGSGVVHMGDLLISESFPSADGKVIEYMELLEILIDVFPADTIFISGHGRNFTLEDLVNYQKMLRSSIQIVRNHMRAGKSLNEMRREEVLKDYSEWDTFILFLNTDFWIGAVYDSYKTRKKNFLSPRRTLLFFPM